MQVRDGKLMRVRLELVLGDDLPELLALGLRDLKLERGGLAGAVAASESAGAPRGTWSDGQMSGVYAGTDRRNLERVVGGAQGGKYETAR